MHFDTDTSPRRPAPPRRRFLRSSAGLGSLAALGPAALAGIALPGAVQAQQGYRTLDVPVATRDPERVEVLEFFWFGCPHCYAFEPSINDWAASRPDYVDFVREAPPLVASWENHSRAFYAAEALKVTDGMFDAMFDAIHRERRPMRRPEAAARLVASLDLGVDARTFEATMGSFAVETAMRRSVKLAREAGVSGVPSILINGRYLTGNSLAGGHEGVIRVIETLTAEEHAGV